MSKIDRMMQLFEYVGTGDDAVASPNGSTSYTYTTSAAERQHADDLAHTKGLRKGEGHIVVYDIETSEILDKMQLPN